MKWPLSFAFLFFCTIGYAQTYPAEGSKVAEFKDFKDCGLVTKMSPNLLPPNCLKSVNNIEFDGDWSMSRRNGYSLYNLTPCTGSQAIRGLWPFYATDGTQYLIAYSSGSMFSSKQDGTCSSIAGLTSLSKTAEMECVQEQGQLYCTNGVDSVFRTNVTSTQTISGAPLGLHIGHFRNRILISGVSGNLTQLYLSGELDGADYALNLYPSLSTSPAIIDISGSNDGQKINCLMGEYQNAFYIGRNYDLYALSGYSNNDFTLRRVSAQIGCIEPKSVQEVNNVLYWMSRRGVEGLSGTQIMPVSYPIYPTIRQIILASGNSRSYTLSSQADWNLGNLSPSGPGATMSGYISPGNVVPSSFTGVDITTGDFTSGSFSALLTTTTIPGSISISSITTTVYNGDFETGDLKWWTCSASAGGQCAVGAGDAISGTYGAHVTVNCNGVGAANVYVKDINDNVLITKAGTPSLTSTFIDLTAYSTQTLKIVFSIGSGVNSSVLTSTTFTAISSISYTAVQGGDCPTGSGFGFAKLDNIRINRYFSLMQSSVTALLTSHTFDTGLSTPTGGLFVVSTTNVDDTNTLYAVRSSSATGGTWTAWSPILNNSQIFQTNRYYQYDSTFTTSVGTKTPTLQSVYLEAETTGYYISTCATPSSAISSWGNFSIDAVSNGGSFTFWTATGTTCSNATAPNAPWTQQPPNSAIVVPTATIVAARVLFSIDSATQVPTLNDIVFNWNEGSSRPPVASGAYQDRYYLFYTTNTEGSPVNDHVAVYDYNKKWTLFDDIGAYSSALYLNKLYIGDSNATGNIYQFDSGQDDGGKSFTMSFQTVDSDLGNPAQRKEFDTAYIFMSAPNNTALNANMSCQYYIDGSTTAYNFGNVDIQESPEQTGYFTAKLPFPVGQVTQGHWISLGCSYFGNAGPISVYSMKLIYRELNWD